MTTLALQCVEAIYKESVHLNESAVAAELAAREGITSFGLTNELLDEALGGNKDVSLSIAKNAAITGKYIT